VTIVAQPMAGWSELWVLHASASGWQCDVLLPALGHPGEDVGYIEVAGFSPDGARVLTAREALVKGRLSRRFEVVKVEGLRREKAAASPSALLAFQRWASPRWRGESLALR
jgi:hypothetical protein